MIVMAHPVASGPPNEDDEISTSRLAIASTPQARFPRVRAFGIAARQFMSAVVEVLVFDVAAHGVEHNATGQHGERG